MEKRYVCPFFPLRISQSVISSEQLNSTFLWLNLAQWTGYFLLILQVVIGNFKKKAWLVLHLEPKKLCLSMCMYYVCYLKGGFWIRGSFPPCCGLWVQTQYFEISSSYEKQPQTANVGSEVWWWNPSLLLKNTQVSIIKILFKKPTAYNHLWRSLGHERSD